MDNSTAQFITNLLENSSLAGALSLFIWVFLKPLVPEVIEWLKSKRTVRKDVLKEVNTNHLHQMPEVLDTLKRIEVQLGKLDTINTGIEVIKAKLNGRNN